MANLLRLTLLGGLICVCVSCETSAPVASKAVPSKPAASTGRFQKVRTTAYTHNEGTGGRNALGRRLSSGSVKSAASDWSRFPLGTRFRVGGTVDEHVIDDYGGALIGTNTIDLYKTSKSAMRRWGVRQVEIEILRWGSDSESLKVLRPRHRARIVRRMIAGLEKKKT